MGKVFVHVRRKIKVRPAPEIAPVDIAPYLEMRRKFEAEMQQIIEEDRATRAAKRHAERSAKPRLKTLMLRVLILSPRFRQYDPPLKGIERRILASAAAVAVIRTPDMICDCCNINGRASETGYFIVCTFFNPIMTEHFGWLCRSCADSLSVSEIKKCIVKNASKRWPDRNLVLLE